MPISPVHLVHDAFVTIGEITIHYVQWGEQGVPIVCVHGLTANAFCFQALADGLAQDHRVFAYDLRGRGDSGKPEHGYSVPLHAADLAGLIDQLGLERPVVIGHSLGALIGVYFAAHYPDKLSKLVLIDAGAPLPWQTPEEQWAHIHAPTLILRAGQGLFSQNDQLLSMEAVEQMQQGIQGSQLVNYPTLNHYTVIFGVEDGPMQAIRAFLTDGHIR